MHGAGLRGDLGHIHGGGRCGEVDHGLCFRHGLERVIGHGDAHGLAAHTFAHVASDPVVAGAFQCPHKARLVIGQHLFDQHLTHTA